MSLEQLKKYADMTNIAYEGDLTDEELQKIGNKVKVGFDEDLRSSADWLADVKKVEELASLASKTKNTPLPNSANIKYPLITKACYEFSSRTYPEIIRDGKVVKGRVLGQDIMGTKAEQCERASEYMNYQLLVENEEWELELDRLLNQLSLVGFICKKTYFEPVRKQIKSEICEYKDLIINADVKNLADAPRISHVLHMRLNDLIEHANSEVFCSEPIDKLIEARSSDELDLPIDIIEQHTFLDLDNDHYLEPYIVTILKDTSEVLRIAPRFTQESIISADGELQYIDAIQLFTDYHFLVSPKGKFQSVGFGILMLHLNQTINTLLNQLVDAGQLANMQGGYKDSRLKELGSGDSSFGTGEWKSVKAMQGITLKDGMLPISYKEPSQVLFQLLGLVIECAKDLSSSTEVMTGGGSADNAKTGAVMALQQQGLKIFTSIQRRIYRSLTNEYRKIFRLNALYLDPDKYFNVLDDRKAVKQKDFDVKNVDIIPVADPNLSSDMQRSTKIQTLMAVQQLPGIDPMKVSKLILQNISLGINAQDLLMDEKQLNQPNPANIKIQADIENMAQTNNLKQMELELRARELQADIEKTIAETGKIKADSILSIAQAENVSATVGLNEYKMQLDILNTKMDAMTRAAKYSQENAMYANDVAKRQGETEVATEEEPLPEEVQEDGTQSSEDMGESSSNGEIPPDIEGT